MVTLRGKGQTPVVKNSRTFRSTQDSSTVRARVHQTTNVNSPNSLPCTGLNASSLLHCLCAAGLNGLCRAGSRFSRLCGRKQTSLPLITALGQLEPRVFFFPPSAEILVHSVEGDFIVISNRITTRTTSKIFFSFVLFHACA